MYIAGWTRKPSGDQAREYPRPRYAVTPTDKVVYDARKPKPFTRAEINKREWKAVKADPERHMTRTLQKRKYSTLSRLQRISAANNPFTRAA